MIDTQKKDEMRASKSELEKALAAAGAVITGKTAKCPFHDDQHKSGGIHEKNGVWTFTCFAASCKFHGDVFDVIERFEGKQKGESLPRAGEPMHREPRRVFKDVAALRQMALGIFPTIDTLYEYADPATKQVQLVVIRARDKNDDKHFLQCRAIEDGFELGAPPKPWPIYNRGRIVKAEWLIIVEGEKCVHALHDCGIVATTSPAGAANARSADWSPCAGKLCYLWPDNDASGTTYMKDVSEMLEKLSPPAKLRWIDPAAIDIPPKGDCVEFIEIWGEEGPDEARRAIEGVIASARSAGAASEVHAMIEETIGGKRVSIDWPFETVSRVTQSLLPGTVTMLCGNPEGGKSLLVIDSFAFWEERNISCALYLLEDDRAYHLSRFAAQRSGESRLTDAKWVRENPGEARRIIAEFSERMDSFGKCLYTAPDEIVTMRALEEWVCKMADEGKRIIGVDPITAAETTNSPWQDDKRFLIKGKTAVRRNGSSLILVTHPRTGPKMQAGLGSMSGGAAYSRFSHSVFWLQKYAKSKRCLVRRATGAEFKTDVSRSLKIFKARNGIGGGYEIALQLDPKSLRFIEQGMVLKESKSDPIEQPIPDEPTKPAPDPTMF